LACDKAEEFEYCIDSFFFARDILRIAGLVSLRRGRKKGTEALNYRGPGLEKKDERPHSDFLRFLPPLAFYRETLSISEPATLAFPSPNPPP